MSSSRDYYLGAGPFPVEQVEILNGILMVMLFWMLFFLVVHLARVWNATRSRLPRGWRNLRASMKIYHANKPELALLVMVLSLFFRTSVLWYVRWLRDHAFAENDFITRNITALLVAFTGMMVVGIACWIRVISPFNGQRVVWLWLAMVTTSLLFGIGMHYSF